MPPPDRPSPSSPPASGGLQQITQLMMENQKQTTRLMAENHQQTMEMFKQFNQQSQDTVKELFTMFAEKLKPPVPAASPCAPAASPCAVPDNSTSIAPESSSTSKSMDASKIVVPVVINTPPKEDKMDLTNDKIGEEKVCLPKPSSTKGREKESSPVLHKPKLASVIKKVEKPEVHRPPIIRDHRRNLKRKSESENSDAKKQKLDRPNSARALAELSIPKVQVRTLEDDHQAQRTQFTRALIKLPVWFPMELSFTAYLVVRFLFVHEKARFHARMHSDKGQNFQQYRKPFHYYAIKAADVFDEYAQKQYVNQAFQHGGPQLKSIIPWFRNWPKNRMQQLTPHCQYNKKQKTVSLRTNVAFLETHLKKLGGKSYL